MENKLVVMIGLPGSGKSTIAQKMHEDNISSVLLSSDSIREELLGAADVNTREGNQLVFNTLHQRLRESLAEGKSVIYDATNINSRKRKGFLSQISKDIVKECVYVATSIEECISRNETRERKVPVDVIHRMHKTLHVPSYSEGWDHIDIHSAESDYHAFSKRDISDKILSVKPIYDNIMPILFDNIPEFKATKDFAQDSSFHSLSVSRHIFHTYKYLHSTYKEENRNVVLLAALFHDIGKPLCKSFKNEDSRYANFIGHENVSAQMTIEILMRLGYTEFEAFHVAEIVQNHMKLSYKEENYNASKMMQELGSPRFQMVLALYNADRSAK